MKSIEQLLKLASNPFYVFTDEETEALIAHENSKSGRKTKSPKASSLSKVHSNDGSAAVKATGKLTRHSNDPVSE